MTLIHQYTQGIKEAMCEIETAKEFLQDTLPTDLGADLSTLTVVYANVMDSEHEILDDKVMELVYSVTFQGKEGYVVVLCDRNPCLTKFTISEIEKWRLKGCSRHLNEGITNGIPFNYG